MMADEVGCARLGARLTRMAVCDTALVLARVVALVWYIGGRGSSIY